MTTGGRHRRGGAAAVPPTGHRPPPPSPRDGSSPDDPPATRSRAIELVDGSGPGEARRAALAGRLGFSETERGELALTVTEPAANLVRHGDGATLILRPSPPAGFRRLRRRPMLARRAGIRFRNSLSTRRPFP